MFIIRDFAWEDIEQTEPIWAFASSAAVWQFGGTTHKTKGLSKVKVSSRIIKSILFVYIGVFKVLVLILLIKLGFNRK